MLLRSTSSPILKCFIPVSVSADTSPGSADHLHIASSSLNRTPLTRTMSESDISERLPPPIPKRKQRTMIAENGNVSSSFGRHRRLLSTNSGLDVLSLSLSPSQATTDRSFSAFAEDDGCVGDGGKGGKICGGSRGGGGDGGFSSDSNNSTDVYYQKMIKARPSDPLILGNYAKYLKEVRGDLSKAEEYCERAILANQEDASILSMYADIIWERSKDAERAESYFDRAVQAAPEDCYVMASYARFLWDAEEDEEEQEQEQEHEKEKEKEKEKEAVTNSWTYPPFFHGQATSTPPIVAAS